MAEFDSGLKMEANIWSNLPDDMMDRILARLPAECFLCLRCVCKRWNALLSSPSFLSLCCKISTQKAWLVMFKRKDHRNFRAYDSFRNKWHSISLSFLPYPTAEIVAASGGLLCLRTPFSLLVCNPLTKNWREFSYYSFENSWFVIAMVAGEAPNGYKIAVAETSGRRTEVYDSRTDRWKRAGDLPLRANLRYEATYCDGVLYFTTSEPFVIMAYSLQKGEWWMVEAPMPQSLTCNRLVSCNDRLYLVGGVGPNGISRSIWVWELVHGGMEWREVQRLPEMMCKKFLAICYHNYEHICCVGHEDFICVSCFTWPEVLVYKLSRRTWHWLPRCPFIPDKASCGFKWFSFSPNLYALV